MLFRNLLVALSVVNSALALSRVIINVYTSFGESTYTGTLVYYDKAYFLGDVRNGGTWVPDDFEDGAPSGLVKFKLEWNDWEAGDMATAEVEWEGENSWEVLYFEQYPYTNEELQQMSNDEGCYTTFSDCYKIYLEYEEYDYGDGELPPAPQPPAEDDDSDGDSGVGKL